MTKKDLIKFEDEIKALFKDGKIKGPIHLGGYNEDQLIKVFKKYKKGDWVLVQWRNHYHWLLAGHDAEELKKWILACKSMTPYADKFFTSAIVGGIAPIAVGIALALKKNKSKHKVWCFLGDMGFSGGIAYESIKYAQGHDLPVIFVVEDNGLSVITDTQKVWGKGKKNKVIKYKYKRKYNHAGAFKQGEKGWVLF